MIGSKLVNRYQILEQVGAGGMAVVYKARCTLLNRIVAVKVLRPQYASDEDFVRRFRREAQAAASLSHPNIVSIYDVGQDRETYFIVMEFVEGETLKELIEREAPLTPRQAVEITRQIANALYHAHNNKIIHRDIKSHNVLVAKDGRVKVTDFGIARAVTATTQTFSPRSLLGSVHYFSPEQARGRLATEQSDIYSLGIVLYEMLTGRLPFDGDSPVSIALKHIQQTIPPLSAANIAVPLELQRILDKMVAKEEGQRYQSVVDLISELRWWNSARDPRLQPAKEEGEEQATQLYVPAKKGKFPIRPVLTGLIIAMALFLGIWGIRALVGLFHVPEVEVPGVVGLELAEALESLDAAGLKYEVEDYVYHDEIPENHVVLQRPAAGRMVRKNRVIELIVSRGPDLVEVPDLRNKEIRAATTELQRLGLQFEIEEQYSNEVPRNYVISQQPLVGEVKRSQVITLVVSAGPRPVNMENLVGRTYDQARDLLRQLMLEERFVVWEQPKGDSPGGIVVRQEPAPAAEIQPGDAVDLWLRPYNRVVKTITRENLEPSLEYRIKIVVVDITNQTREHNYTVNNQQSFSAEVVGWEAGSIRVYVNGALVEEIEF